MQRHPDKIQAHHPLTLKSLSADSELRPHVQQLADGQLASDELLRGVGQYCFAPVTERRQEGDHSLVAHLAPHRSVTPTYVSLRLRMPELESFIWSSSPASLQRRHASSMWLS